MYCPKCGAALGEQGNFCARCGKNVTYLRDQEAAARMAADPENLGRNFARDEVPASAPDLAPPPGGVFYCTYCGTRVFGEDRYCYACGKALLKEYFTRRNKSRRFFIAAVLSIALIVSAVAAYAFFAGTLGPR